MVDRSITTAPAPDRLPAYAAIGLSGGILWVVTTWYPAQVPAILPYQFSWPIFLAVTLSGLWFARGLAE